MIICEGCDGTGKTTLTQMLFKSGIVDKILPSPRIAGKNDPERMKFETDRYLRLHGSNKRIVVDRYLFSEMAYGPVLRGRSAFTRNEYLTRLLEFSLSQSMAIFCFPDRPIFKADESPFIIQNQERIRELYRGLIEDSAFSNPLTYVYKWNEPEAFKHLARWIKDNQ